MLIITMTCSAYSIFAKQKLLECRSEIRIEHGVNDWIQKTVEVTKPRYDARQQRREMTSKAAERSDS